MTDKCSRCSTVVYRKTGRSHLYLDGPVTELIALLGEVCEDLEDWLDSHEGNPPLTFHESYEVETPGRSWFIPAGYPEDVFMHEICLSPAWPQGGLGYDG